MVTFGLLTDTHFAHRHMKINRYYANSAKKVKECIAEFQRYSTDFIIHLGDIIDEPGDTAAGIAAAQEIRSVLSKLDCPQYFLQGNHDADSLPGTVFQNLFHPSYSYHYYSFTKENYTFIFLDCMYRQNFTPYTPGTMDWKELYIPKEQQLWLTKELKKSTKNQVLIFVHALLDPITDPHVIRNAEDIRNIFKNFPNIIAVFQGHKHSGQFSLAQGIPYFTLPAMVESEKAHTCWVVRAQENHMDIRVISNQETGSMTMAIDNNRIIF